MTGGRTTAKPVQLGWTRCAGVALLTVTTRHVDVQTASGTRTTASAPPPGMACVPFARPNRPPPLQRGSARHASPLHELGGSFVTEWREEAAALLGDVSSDGALDRGTFVVGWYRAVRRIALGDAARDDRELTDLLGERRAKANWSFLRPSDRRARERFLRHLAAHVERAEPVRRAAAQAPRPGAMTSSMRP
jgi:hypothetical protein